MRIDNADKKLIFTDRELIFIILALVAFHFVTVPLLTYFKTVAFYRQYSRELSPWDIFNIISSPFYRLMFALIGFDLLPLFLVFPKHVFKSMTLPYALTWFFPIVLGLFIITQLKSPPLWRRLVYSYLIATLLLSIGRLFIFELIF